MARDVLQSKPPFDKAPQTGVFSSRSPRRPNPIGITVVELVEVDPISGTILVDHMDAFDATPILDIKPYIPSSEHIPLERVKLPFWFEELLQPRKIL
jgi:tRNA (Thr-GGU) A37 N-methylase